MLLDKPACCWVFCLRDDTGPCQHRPNAVFGILPGKGGHRFRLLAMTACSGASNREIVTGSLPLYCAGLFAFFCTKRVRFHKKTDAFLSFRENMDEDETAIVRRSRWSGDTWSWLMLLVAVLILFFGTRPAVFQMIIYQPCEHQQCGDGKLLQHLAPESGRHG